MRDPVTPSCRTVFLRIALAALPLLPALAVQANPPPTPAAEDPQGFVQFVLEDDTNCQMRDGQHVLVRSTHPKRTIRVWLDRYYAGVGTGDRSRSDLAPTAEAEALGCSRVMNGPQEWRIVRAIFVD
jgi:hypothetical protein